MNPYLNYVMGIYQHKNTKSMVINDKNPYSMIHKDIPIIEMENCSCYVFARL